MVLCAAFAAHHAQPSQDLEPIPQGFEDLGFLAAGLSYCHLHTFINFTKMEGFLDHRLDTLRSYANRSVNYLSPDGLMTVTARRHKMWFNRHIADVKGQKRRVQELRTRLDPEHPRREKRQALLGLGALAATAGLAFNIFEHGRIQQLEARVDELDDAFMQFIDSETGALEAIQKNQERNLKAINKLAQKTTQLELEHTVQALEMRLDHDYGILTEQVDRLTHVVYHLQQGRIYPGLFDPHTLVEQTEKLAEGLSKMNHQMLHDVRRDAFRFEISFTQGREGVTVFLHVPITSGGVMRLYRMLPAPFFGKDGLLFTLHAQKEILAINEGHTKSLEMTAGQLAGCRRIGRIHYCDGFRIALKDVSSTCSGAVFAGHRGGIKNKCDIAVSRTGEELVPVNATSFQLLTTQGSIRVEDSCKQIGKVVNNGQLVTLRSGCTGFTHNHWFSATGELTSPTSIIHSPLIVTEAFLEFGDFTFSEMKAEVLDMSNNAVQAKLIRLKTIRKRLEASRYKTHRLVWNMVTGVLSLMGILAMITLAAYICWIGRKYRAEQGHIDAHPLHNREREQDEESCGEE